MLQFNPSKRITINEALKHPYLAQFHNPREETVSKKVIHPPVSDNKKLNLKQYKQLIYDRIKKIYSEPETPSVSEYKKSASSIHRASDVLKEKHNEHRHSITHHKTTKVSNSHSKYHHPPSPAHNSVTYSVLNDDEKEKLRKKQSLKDILKNKREKSGLKNEKSESRLDSYPLKYDYHNYHNSYAKSSTTSPLMKYHKHGSAVFK